MDELLNNKKLLIDMLLNAVSNSDNENDIRYICDIHNIRYYSSEYSNDLIVCVYCDYISKTDSTDYTATLYFRVSEVTTQSCNRTFTHYVFDYLNELDCH